MTGGLLCAVSIQHHQSAVVRGGAHLDGERYPIVCGEERTDETPLPLFCQRDRIVDGLVRQDGVHRAERLDVVCRRRAEWILRVEQKRREERAALTICADDHKV